MTTRLANSSLLEQRGVIRFLLAESVKSCEILSRMHFLITSHCKLELLRKSHYLLTDPRTLFQNLNEVTST